MNSAGASHDSEVLVLSSDSELDHVAKSVLPEGKKIEFLTLTELVKAVKDSLDKSDVLLWRTNLELSLGFRGIGIRATLELANQTNEELANKTNK